MKKNYTLSYTNIDIESKDFKFESNMFDNQTMYLLPTEVFNALKKQIDNGTNNNYTFIKNFLESVKMFIDNSVKLYGLNSKGINKVGFRYVKYFYEDLISTKTKYTVGSKSIKYTLKQHTKWTFLILNEVNDLIIKDCKNDLPIDSPANNDLAINTLYNVNINISAAINAEYDRLFNETNKDYNKLYSLNDRNRLFISRIIKIATFHNSRFINKGLTVDRVYSSFSSLTSVSRQFVNYKDQYFYEVDIKNCQPILLALLLIENNLPIDQSYIEDVCNSIFYEQIQAKAKELDYKNESIKFYKFIALTDSNKERVLDYEETLSFENRDDTKRLTYRSVFFKTKTPKTSKTTYIFSKLYPKTFNSIKTFNKLNEGKLELASVLQNKEADIILNIIPTCPYFTVHDAIYLTDKEEVIKVKTILEEKFKTLSKDKLTCEIKINNALDISITKSNGKSEKININSKRKIETKPRVIKSDKLERYNEFVKLYEEKFNKFDIATKLNTSTKTIERYISTYKKENKNNQTTDMTYTKFDYKEKIKTMLTPFELTTRIYKTNEDTLLNKLVLLQTSSTKEIKEIIKKIIK